VGRVIGVLTLTPYVYGSSHYDLPAILRWFTANTGVHHIHHLCSRIPYDRLQRALCEPSRTPRGEPCELLRSFTCVRLALWDESRGCLISFREMRHTYPVGRPNAA
jgi:acyl-lipid omega-6 desaturase (Delta-12 desaturase)